MGRLRKVVIATKACNGQLCIYKMTQLILTKLKLLSAFCYMFCFDADFAKYGNVNTGNIYFVDMIDIWQICS